MERLTEYDLDCGYYVDESFVDKVIYSNINNSRGIQGDAIDRLAEYENREEGCEYCDERNMPLWWNNAGHPTTSLIEPNFCPMCGRKLAEGKEVANEND